MLYEVITEEDVFCYYENYVQEHGSKPFVVEGENFSFNSLTGHVTVTGDGLSEDEMVAAMMEANKKVNEEFPEREQKEIDIQKLTTSRITSYNVLLYEVITSITDPRQSLQLRPASARGWIAMVPFC